VATEGIQVDPEDPITDKRNAFLSLGFLAIASAYPCYAGL
jgi:hypothetical protein